MIRLSTETLRYELHQVTFLFNYPSSRFIPPFSQVLINLLKYAILFLCEVSELLSGCFRLLWYMILCRLVFLILLSNLLDGLLAKRWLSLSHLYHICSIFATSHFNAIIKYFIFLFIIHRSEQVMMTRTITWTFLNLEETSKMFLWTLVF